MIEIRSASRQDLPRITELLGKANDAPYDLARVAEEKCFGAGVGGDPRTLLASIDGRLAGVAVTCGHSLRILAVDRGHRRQSIGSILLREAEKTIEGELVNVAAEAGNYFVPGIPAGDEGLRRFFHLHGYERMEEEPVDLTVDLKGNPLISQLREGDPIRRANHDDRERTAGFVEQAFAKAWRVEAERTFEHELPTLFLAETDGRIVGFSAHDANNRGLGFFGPEGVLPESRGRGIGARLLLASLADLRRMGFQRSTIAWAAAPDFYRRICGAKTAHRFIRLRKALER